jgi:hypothetical protein
MYRRIAAVCAGAVLLATPLLAAWPAAAGHDAPAGRAPRALPGPVPMLRMLPGAAYPKPPTTAQCERLDGVACYAPFQYQTAYNLGPLFAKGRNGKGETIVIVDPFGYQFIGGELAVFDKAFKLPAPPSLRVIQPAGRVPPCCRRAPPRRRRWTLSTPT